jgi:methanethiol S-methyltransferase
MINTFHLLLILFWVLYVVVHSLMAGVWFKRRVEKITRKYYKYYRLFYSFFAAITLLVLLVFQFSHSSIALYKPGVVHYIIALPLAVTGLVVMAICIKKYFVNLSGVDVFIKQARTGVLEKTGLHAYVRHPLYSGTLLFIWALLLVFPLLSNLIAAVIITVYTLVGIRMEEQKLFIEFGDSYKSYAASVPMLIPKSLRSSLRS